MTNIISSLENSYIDSIRQVSFAQRCAPTRVKSLLPVDSSIHNPHLVTVVPRLWVVLGYYYTAIVPRSIDVDGISFWTNRFWYQKTTTAPTGLRGSDAVPAIRHSSRPPRSWVSHTSDTSIWYKSIWVGRFRWSQCTDPVI